ncbi:DUF4011 domain-containing protein [Ferrimonas lipolytica]|uniref:DUF3320 domain-containing protein n=1 Tax=Ferrimonas lipolytica TaxID=2724191 RepID=A0A6H1UCT0_9GAMM|nr:DUF4011 domain-containing protein [Ferrimonas lipolytica]QIZ75612.1 DUF3320 domain-containing protein [Ferrimonas lipolytica]
MSPIANQLELTRKELLDMGLRGNPLLSFRHSSARTLEVIDEKSLELFHTLVTQGKNMGFAPLPSALTPEEDKPTPTAAAVADYLQQQKGEQRHQDSLMQTRFQPDILDRKLLKIETEAKTFIEEQGIDILYIGLGFVHWYEDDNSDKVRRAPLLLVPVELSRGSAAERFKLTYTGAELGPNLTLGAKLRQDFGIELPSFDSLEEATELFHYFVEVSQAIAIQPRWQLVQDEVALGFFSFGKFQMYQDLDDSNWPEGKQAAQSTVLQQLFGEGFPHAEQYQADHQDNEQPLPLARHEQLHLVKDSDSSQTAAVEMVRSGSSMVIQGPPGTGKSQTITNIIAQAISDNKTVLFVSEKMAALEVVKRRLDDTHLGDAVLELHSHKSNKKSVLGSLAQTLTQGQPQIPERHNELKRLQQVRSQLDEYCQQVNLPVLDSGVSYIEALGRSLKVSELASGRVLPEFDFGLMKRWSKSQYLEQLAAVKRLVTLLTQLGVPADGPFAATQLRNYSPVEQEKVTALLSHAQGNLNATMAVAEQLANGMSLPVPHQLSDCHALMAAAKRALKAPDLDGINLSTEQWQLHREEIEQLIGAGKQLAELRVKHQQRFIDAAWQQQLLPLRTVLAAKGSSWFRWFSGDYRAAKNQLAGMLTGPLSGKPSQWLGWIDDLMAYQQAQQQFEQLQALAQRLFGSQWQGQQSDWSTLTKLSEWIVETFRQIGAGAIPAGLMPFLTGGNDLSAYQPLLDSMEQQCQQFAAPFQQLLQRLQLSAEALDFDATFGELADRINQFGDHSDSLYQMTTFNRMRDEFAAAELAVVTDVAFSWQGEPETIALGLQKSYFSGLVNTAYEQRQAINHFDRNAHEQVLAEFRRLDSALFSFAQEHLVNELYQRLPASHAKGEVETIRREMNKKRRQMPIRRLLDRAGRAVQQIKPVFMMSPMSIATYLKPGAVEFDLVVFDEASQVKVADALGAIRRGKQVVVVGDTKQMPPTDFFGQGFDSGDEDEGDNLTADIESILGLFLAQGAPESMLRWHYRSRHESLIAVSNQEFYDNKLMVFPSPGVNPNASGLSHNHLPDCPYDRGGSRTNPQEAQAVVEAVLHHARTKPQLTLGVVAFSVAQRDAILNLLDQARRSAPECETFFADNPENELFFVKNLENVQGDERDVIFISLGYGRTNAGNMSMNFGPLNRDGGERRLNVLISRARQAMNVFSNFTADDLKTDSSSPFGIRALKNFLHYANTGVLVEREETGKAPDSPFEEQVISAIRGLGYEIEPQVGCSGFYIDIAVRDPAKPGRYILAVECDGATYHGSREARDRDRIRQAVLAGLGWRFHRIWSTDWFRNAHKQTVKLQQSIEQAVAYYGALDNDQTQAAAIEPILATVKPQQPEPIKADVTRVAVDPNSDSSIHYKSVGGDDLARFPQPDLYDADSEQLGQALLTVVQTEGPLHIKRLLQVTCDAYGLGRAGAKIQRTVEAALRTVGNQIRCEGHFLQLPEQPIAVRNRAKLESNERKFEWVAPAEIQQALLMAVESSHSLNDEDAIATVVELLGFGRATAKVKAQVQIELDALLQSHQLKRDGMDLLIG